MLVAVIQRNSVARREPNNLFLAQFAVMHVHLAIENDKDLFAGVDTTSPAFGAEGARGATGGLLRGAGSGTMDNIPVRLSNGEFVTNAENTTRFLPLLQAINGFSGGGGGGGRGGGGVIVQVIDERGSQAAPVERQERTSANGIRTISLVIRDTVKRQVSSGELDQPFQARFGLNPATR